jgi:uncharacterized protein (DUF486 family)
MFVKVGMYNMPPGAISTVYFINPSHQSVCLYVYPLIVARQRLGKKRYRGNKYKRNTKIIGLAVFHAVRVVLMESNS